jgi:hypothetical protein
MTDLADAQNRTIVLSPSRDFGATSIERLRKFYKRFGFVRNWKNKKDYTISQAMYRRPNVVKK